MNSSGNDTQASGTNRTITLRLKAGSIAITGTLVSSMIGSLLGSVVLLSSGCSTNTRLDDASYRAIGEPTPQQRQSYAEQTRARESARIDNSAVSVPDFPGQTASLKGNPQDKGNTGSHVVRFGYPDVIDKIVKTARIHCQPRAYQMATADNSFWGKEKGVLQQCTYRFPDFCGGHQFSILNFAGKTILIYQPPKQSYYIIDTLQGTPKSQAGLWDQDDHLGSSTTNASYLFQSDYNTTYPAANGNPASLGWIIKASRKDEEEFGKLYHQAIEQITACF